MKTFSLKNFITAMVLVLFCAVQIFGTSLTLFADETSGDGVSLSELMNNQSNQETTTQTVTPVPDNATTSQSSNNNVINGIVEGLDNTQTENPEIIELGRSISKYVGIISQIIVYVITGLMTLSKLLDIAYIGVPLFRRFLANGYVGNAAANGTANQGMGGMNGMSPMGGMGSPMMGGGMMGGGMMGGGMMGGRYGGRYGGGMMGGDMSGMGMAGQNQPANGRIQFVSNAALNAVASESVLGTDGKAHSAFRAYFSDMVISLIAIGILITLCLTGVVAKLGFLIGEFLAKFITKIKIGA